MSAKNNPIILRPGTNIGNLSAEADSEFLFQCFIDHPALAELSDPESSKIFISGRTGVGKSAFIKMLEKNCNDSIEIDLPDLLLEYVSNSDIVRFLDELDVDLDLFFQTLWKHVLCIQYMSMRYNIKNAQDSQTIFIRLFEKYFGDQKRKSALDYLKKWEGQFWITMDETIKEMTDRIETELSAEAGSEYKKFKLRAGYIKSLGREKKTLLTNRVKKVINSELLNDLGKVISLLSEFDNSDKFGKTYFILIDRIDEKWVDEGIRYRLIRALIETLKSLRKIRKLRIIVAIRSDVIDRVVQETNHAGFQREKYDDYFLRLRWNKTQLRELVERRINFLFRRKYSKDSVFFADLFDSKVGNRDTFDYMIEKTLLRPRDIIEFVNICLERSEGKSKISQSIIRSSEIEYSARRLQSLIEEWQSAFPSLKKALSLISERGKRFSTDQITSDEFIHDFMVSVGDETLSSHDPIYLKIRTFFEKDSGVTEEEVMRQLLSSLYRVGAISIKMSPDQPYQHSQKDTPIIAPNSIPKNAKVTIHPMLRPALGITPNN